MNVLHVLNELRPSGAETMLRAAAEFWRSRGIEGQILVTGASLGEYAAPLEAAGYRLHHLPFRRSFTFLLSVFLFFRRNTFDTIHIHCERANFWYALLAFAAGNKSIARSVHSTFTFRGVLRGWRAAERWILNRCIGVRTITVGPAVQRVEWETFRNRTSTIPNWFDASRFRPPSSGERIAARAALEIPTGALAVITVGNCSEVKNHAAVIMALARIPRHMNLLYLHVGAEEPDCSDRRLAGSLDVSSRIRFLGPALHVAPILHAADLFLMPSRYEGLGIAAVEAMATGLPVVLADVAGLSDLRKVAPAATWVAPAPAAFAEAIIRFYGMSERERLAIGAELSACAHRHFAMESGAAEYAALYAGGYRRS